MAIFNEVVEAYLKLGYPKSKKVFYPSTRTKGYIWGYSLLAPLVPMYIPFVHSFKKTKKQGGVIFGRSKWPAGGLYLGGFIFALF